MAFAIPMVAAAVGSVGGFIAGYMYQPVLTPEEKIMEELHVPQTEINKDLINFDKTKLKPVKRKLTVPTPEQEIFDKLRKKVQIRRGFIEPIAE
jgi:hypothetical protein